MKNFWHLHKAFIEKYFEYLREFIDHLRHENDDPKMYKEFEKLYQNLKLSHTDVPEHPL